MTRLLPIGGLLVAAVAVASCSPRGDVLPPPEVRSTGSASATATAEAALELEDWGAFGMPVPAGAVVDEVGVTHAHYRIPAEYEDVVAFFEDQLPDFVATRYDQGVKLEAQDRSDRSLYVYEDDEDGVLITYMDESPDAAAARGGAGATSAAAARDRVVAPDGSMVVSRNRFGVQNESGGGGMLGPGRSTPSARTARGSNGGGATAAGSRAEVVGASSGGGGGGAQPGASAGSGPSPDPGDGRTVTTREADGTVRRVIAPRERPHRGTTNPSGDRPIDFVHGVYERPQNPAAYY